MNRPTTPISAPSTMDDDTIGTYNRIQEIIDERGTVVGRNRKYGVVFLPEA